MHQARVKHARASVYAPQLIAIDLPTGVDADSGFVDPLTVDRLAIDCAQHSFVVHVVP